MTFTGKIIFILVIFIFYGMSYLVSETNSIRAMKKLFIISNGIALILAVIFSERVFLFFEKFLGVDNGVDGILYLFIVFSIAINIAFLRKIQILESKIANLAQYYSINAFKKKNKS